ncbi:crotonase/enoyl-CoA hydratase family protein [Streptomyces sp. NBC_00378]|uniref:crotonase/enoyl-CoA hydratase family protein n=1 Tax=unclassified Streptomyces TaxID=2593676 RepID=UPI00224E136B|nr:MULTISPECIES: crotonase/enoyl-CoA hydratase family protein [unclassified Streptomyces]MCX5112346.1 crotonase/enoyl-CoA hydratase family protein [Streptomyces sp. NBC_00378]
MTEASGTPAVRTEQHDGVFVITIDRPQARNAINGATARALAAAIDELESRDELLVGILTGANGVFSAGMDLKAFAKGDTPVIEGRGFGGITRIDIKTPLIAAVEGYALGGGTEMALACDMIIAARNATFGQTEVHYGIVPPEGGMVRLPERIPRNIALELLLTGDPLPAARAEQLGLVNHLTEPGEALAQAMELAYRVAHNAPLAITAVKRVVNERTAFRDQDALREQDRFVTPVLASQDAKEGARAFAEKRPPHWQGR